MCGISGKYSYRSNLPVSEDLIKSMAGTMRYRGPDQEGFYVRGPIGLAHNRLSIIDLSTGKQPLSNENNTIWIIFNGEIYNYQELRSNLEKKGHRFCTKSDTEVIVHLYEEHGEKCVNYLRGMFAFAIWDSNKKQIFLARDRVGIKPLYYGLTKDGIVFASEIKAILKDTCINRDIDPQIVDRFLTYFYIPGEKTLLKNVKKLLPGHILIIKNGVLRIEKYWELEFNEIYKGNIQEAEEDLKAHIKDSVSCHLISDVPVGFLLSGGMDSTALLSFASENTDKEVSSFTIGFEGQEFVDERPYARLAAKTFGSRHYETTITAQQFQDFLPDYIRHMEEPVCEPPAIALYYVTQLAKDHVKVLISGEGGDEAFAGYPNYRKLLYLEKMKNILPPWILSSSAIKIIGKLLRSKKISALHPYVNMALEDYYLSRTSSPFSYFNSNYKYIYTKNFLQTIDKNESYKVARQLAGSMAEKNILNKMLYVDTMTWLPDDLLIKADKMTMANSVELRVPLLDHVLLEFAASLPAKYKIKGLSMKHVLKKAFNKKVPREIIKRKKTGFPVPYIKWLQNEMKEYVSDNLLSSQAIVANYIEPEIIHNLLESKNSTAYSKEIFSLLILELWFQNFLN